MKRRDFIKAATGISAGLFISGCSESMFGGSKMPFKISLAQWSLHRRLFGQAEPKLDNLDFAETSAGFGIYAVEYVNQFFKDKATDTVYLKEMKKRAADNGVESVLIMCDGEGNLGDPDTARRRTAVQNHYKWLEAAKFLGCHSIRVNARSDDKLSWDQQKKLAADGLYKLSDYAQKFKLNVIVENHGGLSSNGKWLSQVMEEVNLPNCGTLPDFGNFYDYDRYQGVSDLMKWAKGVSAKSYDFDDEGNETKINFYKMIKIVIDSGYDGYIDVEYEGSRLSEDEGIIATKKLLEKVRLTMV